ncbi:MAG: leucyl/phenylalanyl-tRNA--protein transferase [Methylacidiphilales bacterium]|nr:leucyl/phenylalanyl-tRNA--protein transferase [Candidatus Methylacidiphilales bacterium]
MTRGFTGQVDITPEVLLKAYACGIFPMAESADDPGLYWIEPERRGIIPLDGLHVSRRLARTVRADRFEVRIDRDFEAVLDGCSLPAPGRTRTWINTRIRRLYRDLFDLGHCHSVEAYRDGLLVGGLYGVAIGRAFFGESMFHVETDASKVALVHLVALLLVGGFTLLDTQFSTRHLESFGCIEVSRNQYHRLLEQALAGQADFRAAARQPMPGAAVLAIVQSANERRWDAG